MSEGIPSKNAKGQATQWIKSAVEYAYNMNCTRISASMAIRLKMLNLTFIYGIFIQISLIGSMQQQINSENVLHYDDKLLEQFAASINPHTAQFTSQQIQSEFHLLQSAQIPTSATSFSSSRPNQNRYRGVLAYNHSRVTAPFDQYYLNANYMSSIVDKKPFAIFSQAPMPKQFRAFWQAISCNKIQTVIMLCPNTKQQADQYWPDLKETLDFTGLRITTVREESKYISYTQREFEVQDQQGAFTVKHYHWSGWVDMKTPSQDQVHILSQLIQKCTKLIAQQKIFLVHCSAGIGRTGTFGALLQIERSLQQKSPRSILQMVDNLRRWRKGCVQTLEQYHFLYRWRARRLTS